MKCISCEEERSEEEITYTDKNKPVCDICWDETDPIATVIYTDDSGDYPAENDNTKNIITEFENRTDFKVEWKSTDAWRGYYEVVKSDGWINVHEDCILTMSEDEKELKNFDERLEGFCRSHDITLAKIFCRTSNVCSSGYDVFVKEANVETVKKFVARLKEGHRDPIRFSRTAIRGA